MRRKEEGKRDFVLPRWEGFPFHFLCLSDTIVVVSSDHKTGALYSCIIAMMMIRLFRSLLADVEQLAFGNAANLPVSVMDTREQGNENGNVLVKGEGEGETECLLP